MSSSARNLLLLLLLVLLTLGLGLLRLGSPDEIVEEDSGEVETTSKDGTSNEESHSLLSSQDLEEMVGKMYKDKYCWLTLMTG